MKVLTVRERFKTYINTLYKCGTFLINSSKEEIEYNIFEEFDIGVVSFLYDNNLELFVKEGLIDEAISVRSRSLRSQVMALQSTNFWNVDSVKNSQEWLEIMKLSDEIKDLLKARFGDSGIQEII